MTSRRLDHLVWRHEYGRFGAAGLELELRDEVRRASDARHATEQNRVLLDQRRPDLLPARDCALRAAGEAIDARRYRDAVNELRRGAQTTATMEELADAVRDVEHADAVAAELHGRTSAPILRTLPALASLSANVATARAYLDAARYREASHVARICIRMAISLAGTRSSTMAEATYVQEHTGSIEELCAATLPFTPDTEGDPVSDGSVARLRTLLARDSVVLALRLLTELEIHLAGRLRFLRYVRQKSASVALDRARTDELRLLVRQRSWDGAVDHEWQQAIAAHAVLLARDAARVASSAANLERALE